MVEKYRAVTNQVGLLEGDGQHVVPRTLKVLPPL